MIAIVEHKNGDRRSVADDIAMEHVACVSCKGRGIVSYCAGTLGNLAYYGWQVYHLESRYCAHCSGLGIWREAPALSQAHSQVDK